MDETGGLVSNARHEASRHPGIEVTAHTRNTWELD